MAIPIASAGDICSRIGTRWRSHRVSQQGVQVAKRMPVYDAPAHGFYTNA